MTNIEKLHAWNRDQVENHGLLDINFFVGNGFDPLPEGTTLEQLAGEALVLLSGPGVDITDQLI